VTIEFTIEGWTVNPYTDQLNVDDSEFEGMTGDERESAIDEIVGDAVANVVSWGWHIVEQ